MRVLLFGHGSMGKRRVRNLRAIGEFNISCYETNTERHTDSSIHFIDTEEISTEIKEADFVVVSTPPDRHSEYVKLAMANAKPVFVEASVLLEEVKPLLELSNNHLVYPSSTLYNHPAIKEISEMVQSKRYGRTTNLSYHSGQYLPDWHPWEDIRDYYVSNPLTGAAREILPFELTWMTKIFGDILDIKGIFEKTSDLSVNIDDTYCCAIKFENNVLCSLLIDVTSRAATRRLILNFEEAQLRWDWNNDYFEIYSAEKSNWDKRYFKLNKESAKGYDPSIVEEMYISELKKFLGHYFIGLERQNTLQDDIRVLEALNKLENNE